MSANPSIIYADEATHFLVCLGIPAEVIKLADYPFNLMRADWVEKVWAPWYQTHLEREGLVPSPQDFDCDDHAFDSCAEAHKANTRTQRQRDDDFKAGVLWGMIWLQLRKHAINWAIHLDNDRRPYFQAYEPQPSLGALSVVKVCFRRVALNEDDFRTAQLVYA